MQNHYNGQFSADKLRENNYLSHVSQERSPAIDESDMQRLMNMRLRRENFNPAVPDQEQVPSKQLHLACNSQQHERKMAHWFLRKDDLYRPDWCIANQPYKAGLQAPKGLAKSKADHGGTADQSAETGSDSVGGKRGKRRRKKKRS